jgi:hypothetical protein
MVLQRVVSVSSIMCRYIFIRNEVTQSATQRLRLRGIVVHIPVWLFHFLCAHTMYIQELSETKGQLVKTRIVEFNNNASYVYALPLYTYSFLYVSSTSLCNNGTVTNILVITLPFSANAKLSTSQNMRKIGFLLRRISLLLLLLLLLLLFCILFLYLFLYISIYSC